MKRYRQLTFSDRIYIEVWRWERGRVGPLSLEEWLRRRVVELVL